VVGAAVGAVVPPPAGGRTVGAAPGDVEAEVDGRVPEAVGRAVEGVAVAPA
jgi:hypothetical protein